MHGKTGKSITTTTMLALQATAEYSCLLILSLLYQAMTQGANNSPKVLTNKRPSKCYTQSRSLSLTLSTQSINLVYKLDGFIMDRIRKKSNELFPEHANSPLRRFPSTGLFRFGIITVWHLLPVVVPMHV